MLGKPRTKETLVAAALIAGVASVMTSRARAEGGDQTAFRERCATRLAIALTDDSAKPELFASPDPQSSVDTLIGSAKFNERFARFVNATFNDDPGAVPEEDAAYFLAKHILQQGLPYRDLFTGAFDVKKDGTGAVVVTDDPNGLGYFRSRAWAVRYAGNEATGLKIVTAYRMMNNTLGLELVASTNAPDADISATGRAAPACAGCHFQPWFALDNVASILTRRKGTGDAMTFVPSPTGAKEILGGVSIGSDKELVEAMVKSEAFTFRACRLAFKFLYGRVENACEGAIFDKCVDAFSADGKIQSAISAVAKDPSFCE